MKETRNITDQNEDTGTGSILDPLMAVFFVYDSWISHCWSSKRWKPQDKWSSKQWWLSEAFLSRITSFS